MKNFILNMTGTDMKKLLLISINIFVLFMCSGCFLEVGYWQQMAEMFDRGTEVSSMPDCTKGITWTEIPNAEAQTLWNSDDYRENMKKNPSTADIYQKEYDGTIRKYSSVPVDKFPNWIYEREKSEYIYAFKFNSQIIDDNIVHLNYYIPSNVPDGTKIYKASTDASLVKMEIPHEVCDPDYTGDKNVTASYIFKNGFLVQQHVTMDTYIEY